MTGKSTFQLPDLGEGLTEAEIVAWHVNVGDRVVADQPLLSVETDKAIVEIPSPRAGIVASLHCAPGERIAVGDALLEFAETATDTGAIVGRIPSKDSVAIKASPAVRRLARDRAVDLGRVAGTGPNGTILTADVERAAAGSRPRTGQPITGVRRAMAERMTDAHRRVVPATVTAEADIHGWVADTRPMPRLVRALCTACKANPRLNAAFDDTRLELEIIDTIDLGIAMDFSEGLFVPVLRNAASLVPREIEAGIAELEQAVKARKISASELRGQSITLSNFGTIGGLHAAMVVVPPQVAIVGAGQIFERVVMGETGPVSHRKLPLSVTIDHRVITGAEASRFMAALVDDLEFAE